MFSGDKKCIKNTNYFLKIFTKVTLSLCKCTFHTQPEVDSKIHLLSMFLRRNAFSIYSNGKIMSVKASIWLITNKENFAMNYLIILSYNFSSAIKIQRSYLTIDENLMYCVISLSDIIILFILWYYYKILLILWYYYKILLILRYYDMILWCNIWCYI